MTSLPNTAASSWPHPVRARRGGHGISTGGLTLALVADLGQGQLLWLKASPDTRGVFEAAGCQRFTYQAKGKPRSLGFYNAPVEQTLPLISIKKVWNCSFFIPF